MRVKEITVTIPEYLYQESLRITELGMFSDLSELISSGIRRELKDARALLALDAESWQEGLAHLRARIRERRTQEDYAEPTEEQVFAELRALRQIIWQKEHRPRYTLDSRQ